MVIETDLYEILQVTRTANHEDIKKAFRKLALQYHPDRNPGNAQAEEKFREAAYAYEILSDSSKRSQYDKYGHQAFRGGMGGSGSHGGFDFEDFFRGRDFTDIFEEVFRGFGQTHSSQHEKSQRMRGSDIRYDLEITLEEAFKGKNVELSLKTLISCETCQGKGSTENAPPESCKECKGHGKQRFQQGFFLVERTCSTCQGMGTVIKNPCKSCKGQGRSLKEKKLSITVPVGVEDGVRLRVEKEGEAGLQGASPGDLYIFIHIKEHALFEREGLDLFCRMPISMITATLGGEVDVPTLETVKATIKIPEGAQTGQVLRLKGKGMRGQRERMQGDLHVEIFVETPVNLTKKQKALLMQLKEDVKEKIISPKTDNFFKKVKKLWEQTSKES